MISLEDRSSLEPIAHMFYTQRVMSDQWAKEQDHVKWGYYDQAEQLVRNLDEIGLCIAEKPVKPAKKETKRVGGKSGTDGNADNKPA